MNDSPCPLCGYFHDELTPHGRSVLDAGRIKILKTDSGDASSVRSFRVVSGGAVGYDKLVREAMGPSNYNSVTLPPFQELGQFQTELLANWKWLSLGFIVGYLVRRHFVK